jgi:omega-6 fatty acid desaturase (delta-12 desaturase)
MSSVDASKTPGGDASGWVQTLAAYRTPGTLRAIGELAITALSFVLTWYLMFWSLAHGQVWLYALLVLPAAGFVVRLFLIQHDCGHQAFFAHRRANDWVGRCLGVLTITAYDHWRLAHAIHHATSGNLDKRGVGDIDTITVAEYQARSFWTRLRYRLYRHPLVMFGIGPLFVFVLQNRLPAGFMRVGWRPWASTMATNAGIAVLVAGLVSLVGIGSFLLVVAPVMLLAATAGGWLFYVQHQFDHAYWEKSATWDRHAASLHGSSHYDLPLVLRWMTANIGVHHVHHLSSRIPFYRLPRVLSDHPELRDVGRVTLWQSFGFVRLALWDEEAGCLISFKQLRNRAAQHPEQAPASA